MPYSINLDVKATLTIASGKQSYREPGGGAGCTSNRIDRAGARKLGAGGARVTKLIRILALWLGAGLLAACGGGSGTAPSQPPPAGAPISITYSPSSLSAPAGQAITPLRPTVTGQAQSITIAPALPSGLSLDQTTGVISGTPERGAAEQTYTVTATSGASTATARLTLSVFDGVSDEVKLAGSAETPVVEVSNPSPAGGETITVRIAVSGATRIELTTRGNGCGGLTSRTGSGASLELTGAVAAAGHCVLEAAVQVGAVTTTYAREFDVSPRGLPAYVGGIIFPGGVYMPSGDANLLPVDAGLTIRSVSAPQAFINGGSGSIFVTPSAAGAASRAIVRISGFPGYFVAPVTATGGQVRIDLALSQDFVRNLAIATQAAAAPLEAASGQSRAIRGLVAQAPRVRALPRAKALSASRSGPQSKPGSAGGEALSAQAEAATLTATVQLLTANGAASAPVDVALTTQQVNAGSLQVSLRWNAAADVDLHVVAPSRDELFYGRRSIPGGGSLDLDSNAGCRIDGVNNENVSWPGESRPADGSYVIRVDYWSACGVTAPVTYTVTVTNCGVTTTYTGILSPGDADRGGAGSGRTVATIQHRTCAGLSVKGTATYDDYSTSGAGLGTTARKQAIRYADVEVRQVSDDGLLGSTATDVTGAYSVEFSMATPAEYYVMVLARQSKGSGKQKVVRNDDKVYAIKTPNVNAATTPRATGLDLNATRAGLYAEAFNILDIGVKNFDYAKAQFSNSTLPELTWIWTAGVKTCNAKSGASCYLDQKIWVLGVDNDRDEYDDSVLAHEFGHFVMHIFSLKGRAPVGSHHPKERVSPLLAWSEGVATFWGQSVLGGDTYVDTFVSAMAPDGDVRSLETPEADVLAVVGNAGGALSGDLSEGWVYATLWDFADAGRDSRSAAAEAPGGVFTDTLSNPSGVFSGLAAMKTSSGDRGAAGADLMDFLDEWLCAKRSTWDPAGLTGFRGVVVGLNQISFTPAPAGSCP